MRYEDENGRYAKALIDHAYKKVYAADLDDPAIYNLVKSNPDIYVGPGMRGHVVNRKGRIFFRKNPSGYDQEYHPSNDKNCTISDNKERNERIYYLKDMLPSCSTLCTRIFSNNTDKAEGHHEVLRSIQNYKWADRYLIAGYGFYADIIGTPIKRISPRFNIAAIGEMKTNQYKKRSLVLDKSIVIISMKSSVINENKFNSLIRFAEETGAMIIFDTISISKRAAYQRWLYKRSDIHANIALYIDKGHFFRNGKKDNRYFGYDFFKDRVSASLNRKENKITNPTQRLT